MKILFDTNVVLDLLLARSPWSRQAAELFSHAEAGNLVAYLGATTVTTVHYLTAKLVGQERAREEIGKLLALCRVAPVNRAVLEGALLLGLADYEDAVLHEAARQVGADAIVTRDNRDFRKSLLPVLSPEECLRILGERSRDR